MFSYFKNKKNNRRRSEYVNDVKIFIQVHFVRERSSERYKYNTLSLKTDPERDACREWYEEHNNPTSFADIVQIYLDEKKINLFTRANSLRFKREFDAAEGIYQSLVSEFPEEAEAYWGLYLCRYGI